MAVREFVSLWVGKSRRIRNFYAAELISSHDNIDHNTSYYEGGLSDWDLEARPTPNRPIPHSLTTQIGSDREVMMGSRE